MRLVRLPPPPPPSLAGFASNAEFVVRVGFAFTLAVAATAFVGTLIFDQVTR